MFPTIKDNPDYTAVIAERHFERIKGYVDDARAKGAEIIAAPRAARPWRSRGLRRAVAALLPRCRYAG